MKEINIYDSLFLETLEGQVATDRMKLFVPLSGILEDGSIITASFGNQLVDNERGYTFIVDNYVCSQFEKLRVELESGHPTLKVKKNEEVINNKSPEELEIERLQQELLQRQAELNAKMMPK